ncbi:MAG: SIS domain-containing protein [Rubrivivax sp.]
MLEQRIQQQFFDSSDLALRAAEVLVRPIADATAALLSALTGGGKVMVAGAAAGQSLAHHMARLLTGRFERERPPLAGLALALGADAAQQVRALGSPGDVLLYIDDGEGHSSLVITAAQDRDMTIVVLAGLGAHAFGELLAETDVLVAVPHERAARVTELQLMVLHILCDAVDFQLLGEQDP